MKTFTAHDLHQKRQEVYQAALQGPVKITHKFHGDFVLMQIGKGQTVREMNVNRDRIILEIDSPTDKPLVNYDASRFPAMDDTPIVRSDGNILIPIGDNKFVVESPAVVDGDTFEVVTITHPLIKPIVRVKKVDSEA